ncbi:MAG: cell division protein ZapE [Planctomycetes bacterium]|nr:cell division protein ZapE [Planctomycetota bacterium]
MKTLKGESDPLEMVAERIAKATRVLCFDELFVADIADAMILGGLFGALIRYDVALVFTSNATPPAISRWPAAAAFSARDRTARAIHWSSNSWDRSTIA